MKQLPRGKLPINANYLFGKSQALRTFFRELSGLHPESAIALVERLETGGFPESTSPTRFLLGMLADSDPWVRHQAALALGTCRKTHSLVVPALTRAAQARHDPLLRAGAAYGLGKVGAPAARSAPILVRMLRDKSSHVRCAATFALGQIKPTADGAFRALLGALRDRDAQVRRQAVESVGALGVRRKRGISALVRRVRDKDKNVRAAAYQALAKFGPHAKSAVPSLMKRLHEHNPLIAEALWNINRQIDEVMPSLLEQLSLGWEETCDVISKIGPAAKAAVPALIDCLGKEDWDLNWAAADALGAIGANAQAAIPALTAALDHQSGVVAGSAAKALSRIGEKAVPALSRLLESGSARGREYAAEALMRMGKQAGPAVPALSRQLKQGPPSVVPWAAIAIAMITQDPSVIPHLGRAATRNENPYVRRLALRALAAIPGRGARKLGFFKQALSDDNAKVRRAARRSLEA